MTTYSRQHVMLYTSTAYIIFDNLFINNMFGLLKVDNYVSHLFMSWRQPYVIR